jgi:hypothetical protein
MRDDLISAKLLSYLTSLKSHDIYSYICYSPAQNAFIVVRGLSRRISFRSLPFVVVEVLRSSRAFNQEHLLVQLLAEAKLSCAKAVHLNNYEGYYKSFRGNE